VIGASGELTGFAGGLANKMLLLSLEAGQTSLEAAADRQAQAPADAANVGAKRARPAPPRSMQGSLFGN
jgi:methylated-DNA-[protein]-cysteine S-methyltransferase